MTGSDHIEDLRGAYTGLAQHRSQRADGDLVVERHHADATTTSSVQARHHDMAAALPLPRETEALKGIDDALT